MLNQWSKASPKFISEWIKPLKTTYHSGVYSYLVLVATDGANVAQYKTRETRLQLARLVPGGIYTVSIYPMQIRAELDTAHAQVFGFQTCESNYYLLLSIIDYYLILNAFIMKFNIIYCFIIWFIVQWCTQASKLLFVFYNFFVLHILNRNLRRDSFKNI